MNAQVEILAPESAQAVETFTAWCIPEDGQDRRRRFGVKPPLSSNDVAWFEPIGQTIELGDVSDLRQAVDTAASVCRHKSKFVVLHTHPGRNYQRAHFYVVKQESQLSYNSPVRELREKGYRKQYWEHLFDLDFNAFQPTPPPDVMKDPVGIDRTLVQAS